MSNFSIFPTEWNHLLRDAQKAEHLVYDAPDAATLYCRKTLEAWLHWMYENDASLQIPYDNTSHKLMTQPDFVEMMNPVVIQHMHTIRKLGNRGSHTKGKPVSLQEALHGLELTYGVVKYLLSLYQEDYAGYPTFDKELIPLAQKIQQNIAQEEIKRLKAQLAQASQLNKISESEQEKVQARREENTVHQDIPTDPNEALTRKIYIDAYLQEAGWDLSNPQMMEYRVEHMPNTTGIGYADYVLFGKDGKPLAVIEAKKTTEDAQIGRHQAELYAQALEKKFGQLPMIFLTNGYQNWLYDWDSPIRQVYGFYTQDELQRLMERKKSRLPLADITINESITDRYYQKEAIRAVCERFTQKHRGALLVMATGTGKTRTAASLIDVLSKANWVKNVLFLADRTALVSQAKGNLNNYLSDFPSVRLLDEEEKSTSRLVFSTYQKLINLIDDTKTEDAGRFYGVGHFDLIIFDEIHRSVYNKYKAIFDYFDGYKIGLTATPRQEDIDRNTYELFGLAPGNPTYNYSLEQAVEDAYLVNYQSYPVNTKFRRDGIKYHELSEEEKLEYEEKFGDPNTGEIPDEIDAAELDKWIYNTGTADVILAELMEKGIKVENGEKLGKTIIFTRKRDHAEFLRKRFNVNYPQYGDQFLKVIDYKTKYSDDILEKFKMKDKNPVVACSVDMLDTGIDVPEIVNLVFLKPVKSPIKFWQMIGRGTRLCKDLFGDGMDKSSFLIFDFCQNFHYFSENERASSGTRQMSLNEKLFLIQLKLAQLFVHQQDADLQEFGKTLKHGLHQQVVQLHAEGKDSFVVRRHLQEVEKFAQESHWEDLSDNDIRELNGIIASLVYDKDTDPKAKSFDYMLYDLMLNMVQANYRQTSLIKRVMDIGSQLNKKANRIPTIKAKEDILQKISQSDYWEEATPTMVEQIRVEIRDLIKFLDNPYKEIVITHLEDEIISAVGESPVVYEAKVFDKAAYERNVRQFVEENKHHIVIDKLHKNIKITTQEIDTLEKMLLAQGDNVSKEHLDELHKQQTLGQFIRSIVGLERNAAKQAFSKIIDSEQLNTKQIRFLDMIINKLVENGLFSTDKFEKDPDFNRIDSKGIIHLFGENQAKAIYGIVKNINKNGEAG